MRGNLSESKEGIWTKIKKENNPKFNNKNTQDQEWYTQRSRTKIPKDQDQNENTKDQKWKYPIKILKIVN